MLFPTLGPSSLPVVVAQLDERHANRTVSVKGATRGRGLRELKPSPPLARSKLRKKIRSFNF